MRITMKHFESGDRKVEWDSTPTQVGRVTPDEGWIGYTIFVRKPEVRKCATPECTHLTVKELCKTCTKQLDPVKMLHPNLLWPDGGGGVVRWLSDDSDDLQGV